MKEVFVQCPICRRHQKRDSCALATFQRVIDGKRYIYCCETLAEKDKHK